MEVYISRWLKGSYSACKPRSRDHGLPLFAESTDSCNLAFLRHNPSCAIAWRQDCQQTMLQLLGVILFTCCKIKVKTCLMNVHRIILQPLAIKSKRPAYPKTVVVATFLKVLCTSQFSAAVGTGFSSDTERRQICSIWRHASTTTKWLATINILFMKYTKSRRGMPVVLAKPREEMPSSAIN